ncbi:unnamed protein product [Lymnaea stagnalis]|uniref:BZIP domain-containing protein n=1 Tax=Lymnaea stagnalis TaxID=6523 RepID=A0AAV2ILB4_LYMST
MVRVVSQNFSPPRSRHSSGETDRDLAERANLALGLSTLGRKRVDLPDSCDSSDSFWDSELDGDHYDTLVSESGETSNDINGNENPEKSDVQSKRKERRRERNKLSAQAYRQRRRHQSVKDQQQLMQLEAENKRLHKLVEALEKKTEDARQRLRNCSVPVPDLLALGAVGGSPSPSEMNKKNTNINDIGPQFHIPASHHDLTTHHPPLNPSPTFGPNLPSPMQIADPRKQIPILVNGNTAGYSTFCPANRSTSDCNSTAPTHLFINTNAFEGSLVTPEGTKLPAVCIPAFFAVPLENNSPSFNSNLNCKPLKPSFPKSKPTPDLLSLAPNDLCSGTPQKEESQVIRSMWWNVKGNQCHANGNVMIGAAVCGGNMESCNSGNMNNANLNAIDPNGNNDCDKKSNMQQINANSQNMSFNINQTAGTIGQGGQELEKIQHMAKHPSSVQYYLHNDQSMSVSVK